MNEPLTPRDHGLKVAVLAALKDKVDGELKKARAAAEAEFAGHRKDGSTQQEVLLPDGTKLGLISIKAGTDEVVPDGPDTLMDWCRAHFPQAIEEYVTAPAFESAEVIEVVGAFFPHLVRDRIRASHLTALKEQVTETGGYLIDGDGGKTKVAQVVRHDPSGAFAYRAAKGAQDRIVTEWMAGRLREIALGPLALPVAGGDPDD